MNRVNQPLPPFASATCLVLATVSLGVALLGSAIDIAFGVRWVAAILAAFAVAGTIVLRGKSPWAHVAAAYVAFTAPHAAMLCFALALSALIFTLGLAPSSVLLVLSISMCATVAALALLTRVHVVIYDQLVSSTERASRGIRA